MQVIWYYLASAQVGIESANNYITMEQYFMLLDITVQTSVATFYLHFTVTLPICLAWYVCVQWFSGLTHMCVQLKYSNVYTYIP